ncbi:trigger factor [bacterium]|nr:trigger factor [bacterium]
MNISKKDLEKSRVELTVKLPWSDFEKYLEKGAKVLSEKVKVEGFRPGKVPVEVLKQKVGEIAILEEAAYIAINKTLDDAIKQGVEDVSTAVGQPNVSITKLAKDNDLEYKIEVAVLPEVKLGKIKDLGIKTDKTEVKKEEIEKTLEQLTEMRIQEKIVSREVKDTDKVLVDIAMTQDKVPVEGGQSQDVAIIIGKDYLIPGFDKNLLGAKKGEEKTFSLPFPKEHHQKNLAGKMVDFKITIKEVYERIVPKIDDELAKTLQFKDLGELKKALETNIKAEKEQKNKQKAELKMLDEILKGAKIGELPEVLIENESQNMLREFKGSLAQQGAKFEDYLGSINKTEEQFVLEMLPEATKRVKLALIIRKVGEEEKITPTEKEIEEQIEEIAKKNKGNEDVLKNIKSPAYKNYLNNLLTNQKVIKSLREWNIK